ncbi:hypothetical protein M3Y97_01081200 [Aphelenchoides bicaudatus]|nr:hypothetical protein M3Y97_01081200 [Aphelenchoides bicaudatus]
MGLYALCLASFVYPVFASWTQGSMCAFAIIQLMCGAAVEEIMSNGNETELATSGIEPSTIVSTLTFMNGVMFLIFALLRLQFLTTHFSKPLISGFLTAAILHLIMAQIGNVIGVKRIKHKEQLFGQFFLDLYNFFLLLPKINWMTFGMSVICFIFLLSSKSLLDAPIKRWTKSKRFIVPWELLLIAFHISLARVMCQRKKYAIDEQQEIYAMSTVHLFTGFFPSFPTTNGLGRAMVIDACGATSQLGNFSFGSRCAFWLLLCWCRRGELLMKFKELPYYWRKSKWDGFIWISTFVASLSLDVILGLAVGVAIQMFSVVTRTQWPKWNAKVTGDVAILKFHSMLTFSNIETFNEAISEVCRKWSPNPEVQKYLLLDCSAINAMDTSGMEELVKTRKDLKNNYNSVMMFVEMEDNQQHQLIELDPKIDTTLFFSTLDDALAALHLDLKQSTSEKSHSYLSSV